MNWTDILLVEWVTPAGIKIAAGPIFIGLMIIVVLIRIGAGWFTRGWDVVEAQIGFQVGHIKIRCNPEVKRIAHQAWTELQTRKAALPFDEDHDIITEIYDSWYSLFGEFRKLIKSIPAECIKTNKDTEKLITLMVSVLNQGLRPHLTRWQGRFRAWFKEKEQISPNKSPQEIQREFPDYQVLVADLKLINSQLQTYAAFLKDIAHGVK